VGGRVTALLIPPHDYAALQRSDLVAFIHRAGIDTETLASFGLAAMMANDNDLIRSPPIPV
jgi:hypothetical protein